jgi:hypothetical protein
MNPADTMKSGVEILEPLLTRQHGFSYRPIGQGHSSGGDFVSGEFQRGDRRLELHLRHSLGLVTHYVGSSSLSHEDYIWSVLGQRFASSYPEFSEDPLQAFRDLKSDIDRHVADFLSGSDDDFLQHVHRAAQLKNAQGQLP